MTSITRAICILIASAVLLPLSVAIFGDEAAAIPAFARKHKVSCSTCHIAVPKLKPYGDDYAGNGFVLPDGEEPDKS